MGQGAPASASTPERAAGARRWPRRLAWGVATVSVLALMAVLAIEPPDDPTVERGPTVLPPDPALHDAARALLDDLAPGDKITGWTVQTIDGPTEGVIRIDVARDGLRFALMVAAKERYPEPPPVQTERYAIFFGHVDPPKTALPDGTIRATTHALARRIRAREHEVEVPGL